MECRPENIARLYLELTKYKYQQTPSAMMRGEPMPPAQSRRAPDSPLIELSPPELDLLDSRTFSEILVARRSRRTYAAGPLLEKELSLLLYTYAGVRREAGDINFRTSPSAGARHPLDSYLAINRVEGFEPGLYHYLPLDHALEKIAEDADIGRRFKNATLGQNMPATAAVNFIWAAVYYRSGWKYGPRGLRYVYLDAGHACQNLYLAAEALGLGCCSIGAFDDDVCAELLDLDGEAEFCVYLASVGRAK